MKLKSHLGALLLGIVLGIAVALPVTALASNWLPLFGDEQGKTAAESSFTNQQPSPLAPPNVHTARNSYREHNPGQYNDMHEQMPQMMERCRGMMDAEMTEQCAAMMDGKTTEQCAAMMDAKMTEQCAAMMDMMQGMKDMHDMQGMMHMHGMMAR